MRTVFEHYMDGMNIKELVEATGVSKGAASNYLNQIELAAGCRIIRGRSSESNPTARIRNEAGLLRASRKDGQRAASVRDFHSFRVTWVTEALTAGVPLEVVRKVTGHKTAEIVLKHYFKPGRQALRQALQTAMPNLLANGSKSPEDEVREILEQMTAKTWRKDRDRLMKLVAAS